MDAKVNLLQALAGVDRRFAPRTVARLNDYKVQVVKARGEFVWHSHAETDDFFLVVKGRLTIQLRDRDVQLEEGELWSPAASSTARGPTRRRSPADRAGGHHQHGRRRRPARHRGRVGD